MMNEKTQESRNEQVACAVTPTEKKRIRFLAAVLETDVSALLRRYSVDQALQEAAEYRERLPVTVPSGEAA